ncbi:hypothetical protein SELMODRAFT_449178 [Selaginella moellendorffii]|uniref:RCC1-like domain-containing protein n=1 Tax=Selaginella moellendorffii TaxID=88036 RepID=D8TDD9_SELML|nr:ultraviolet-B receptor UVR8 [Selaginella moellendorffii]EFJ05293.1 hypothetical protein SELMODRAFT_449178 [Selaginella moellendorffii]|eukprot:XP_002993601.1 ultraviolet-B receptor UVR8 [Selaginella moellendorffii]
MEEQPVPARSVLYAWGYNQCGQAGQESAIHSAVPHPIRVAIHPSSLRLIAISCGLEHTAAIASDGSLFTWGSNQFGQLGDGSETNSDRPKRVYGLRDEAVKSVACGANCTAAIADSRDGTCRGRMWIWGQNQGSNSPRLFSGVFSSSTVVIQVACGGAHAAALSEHGVLQTWGYNEHGQLGRGISCEGLQGAKIVTSFVKFLNEPVETVKVKQVVCGEYHTAAIAHNGDVYTWGLGSSGQLGHRSLQSGNKEVFPRRVVTLEGVDVVQISAGGVHSCAISSAGGLYMWGGSHAGQLGLGPRQDRICGTSDIDFFFQRIPVLVIPSGARSATCGDLHTLVRMANGRLLGCGYNSYGQADSGKAYYAWYPSPIDWCVGEITCLAAGGGHSAVLTQASNLKEICELKLVDYVTASTASTIADIASRMSCDSLARFCLTFRDHWV